jgi:hypothetical protein
MQRIEVIRVDAENGLVERFGVLKLPLSVELDGCRKSLIDLFLKRRLSCTAACFTDFVSPSM